MMVRDHFRTHARRRVELRATVRSRDGGVQPVTIRDLGLGGACVELADEGDGQRQATPLEREAILVLEVITPSLWDPLTVRGKVAWIRRGTAQRPARAGIRFEHRESAAVYALFQLLATQAFD
jgi:hypothetical protein